ncbi:MULTISPECIES: hypothetical protein [unclassified Mesorhizobium]|uniref:hypothetical protein n=1 Tax=unclassified Mesorhizobium TaxID=325217 RepID=UPI00142EC915|nr:MULTISPECIES: hypothetical protein [unclassified Mesorhizobium]
MFDQTFLVAISDLSLISTTRCGLARLRVQLFFQRGQQFKAGRAEKDPGGTAL